MGQGMRHEERSAPGRTQRAAGSGSVARWLQVLLVGGWFVACTSREPAVPSAAALPGAEPEAITARELTQLKAPDKHARALGKLLERPFARLPDRADALRVALPDGKHWKRVRFSLVDHYVGFRYGKNAEALAIALVQPLPAGERSETYACMRSSEASVRPLLDAFDVQLDQVQNRSVQWRKQRVQVRTASGAVDYGFGPRYFAVAWAAYPAYRDGCLLFGLAVPWDGERALAESVRDRWIGEGFKRLQARTDDMPR